jgi:hypothetical protein
MADYNLLLGDLFAGPWASRGGHLKGAAGKEDLWEASGYVMRRLWERLGRPRPIMYISKTLFSKTQKISKIKATSEQVFLEGLRLRHVHQRSHGFKLSRKQRFSRRLIVRPRLATCALFLEPFAHV